MTKTDTSAVKTQATEAEAPDSDLLYTNPLLHDDIPVENARAVLAMLTRINLSDAAFDEEGNYGLVLVLEWIRRSLAYSGHENVPAIPLSNQINGK